MESKLPKNWVLSNISELLDVNMGQSPPSSSYNTEGIGIPFMQGKTEFGNLYPKIRKYTTDPKKIVQPKTVLLSVRAPIGPTNVSQTELCIGRGLAGISSDILPLNFLLYYLRYIEDILDAKGTGTTFKAISKDKLLETNFPLPPLAEQQRIVAKLDTLFGSLDALKIRLNNIPQLIKNFKQAVLTQAVTGKLTQEWRVGKELEDYSDKQLNDLRNKEGEFENINLLKSGRRKQKIQSFTWNGLNKIGWAQVNIESAAIFIIDCLHNTPKFELKGEYVIDTTCISPFKIHWEKARKINQEYFEKWVNRLAPKNGDILFSREGTIGIGIKVPKEKKICIGQRMMLFRFGSYILPEFSEIYMNSMVFRDEFRPHIKGVAAQHLNIGDIRKLNFPIPSKEEQTEIVKRVENLFSKADAIEKQYKTLKEKIDRLPQAILAKAFKGELVAQLPTDGDAKDLLEEIKKLKESLVVKPKKKVVRNKK
ncbi:restriction endonuclease subunit S [Tenacibaculum finnmarkense]|uniref:restriction endonuclease subunit S n=1 Tax=Tenacibaculum finnmarkense TaxID=2781243 RepID=UPI00187B10E9|nr:restriction endonuclease subunit S [Tenacibaculum finnmarkense]MBE7692600.1 hypothetical protein [Tenacibaculum finnmarkense genomovar finnmarkense]